MSNLDTLMSNSLTHDIIIKFEEGDVSHEEQMKTVFQFFKLMLEGYQDMELRGEELDKDKKNNMIGTPDYIIWNKKEMIFVEVKRKNEKLSDAQIQWGEFLIKNNVLYKVVRVVGK